MDGRAGRQALGNHTEDAWRQDLVFYYNTAVTKLIIWLIMFHKLKVHVLYSQRSRDESRDPNTPCMDLYTENGLHCKIIH